MIERRPPLQRVVVIRTKETKVTVMTPPRPRETPLAVTMTTATGCWIARGSLLFLLALVSLHAACYVFYL